MAAAFAAATMLSTPAFAGDPDGHWQVKLLGTGVLVDGKINKIEKDLIGLPAGSQSDLNDNVVPTVAIEYFATPNVSVETICCLTQHHGVGAGPLAGASLIDHIMILPATVTLKYHLPLKGVRPYVGVGPSVFFFIDEKPGATAKLLGATRVRFENRVGVVLQAGLDIPVNGTGLGVSIDAKKYFMNTAAHFYAGSTEALVTEHKLDPWVLSAGVSYRF
jgi:outer membrane protein